MFESLKPSHSPKRMWLAMVVIAAIAMVGIFVMFSVMYHSKG